MRYKTVLVCGNYIKVNRVSNFYLMQMLDGMVRATASAVMQAFDIAKRRGLI